MAKRRGVSLLIVDGFTSEALAILEAGLRVVYEPQMPRQNIPEVIGDVHGIVVRARTPLPAEVLQKARRLRVVGVPGVGLDHVDVAYAHQRGIAVLNVLDANTESVAELTVCLIIAALRRVIPATADVRKGRWDKSGFMGSELAGKTLGILGLGRVGQRVAHLAQAFGAHVVGYDTAVQNVPNCRIVPMPQLFRDADIVSLHVPLTPETHHLVGKSVVKAMKPTAILLNMARGGIVDEEAIYDVLHDGSLGGYVADVWEQETQIDGQGVSPNILGHSHVIMTPHIGAWTVEAQARACLRLAVCLRDFFQSLSLWGASE